MAQSCSVCIHPHREEIDRNLIAGKPYRYVAVQYRVSKGALQRHKGNGHIQEILVKAEHAAEITRADTMLDQVRHLNTRAVSILDQAEQAGDLKTALQGIREARGCQELLMRVAGELNDSPQVNILVSPQWLSLRAIILQALEPYPEARARLAEVLNGGVQPCLK